MNSILVNQSLLPAGRIVPDQ